MFFVFVPYGGLTSGLFELKQHVPVMYDLQTAVRGMHIDKLLVA